MQNWRHLVVCLQVFLFIDVSCLSFGSGEKSEVACCEENCASNVQISKKSGTVS